MAAGDGIEYTPVGERYGRHLIVPVPEMEGDYRCACLILLDGSINPVRQFQLAGPFRSRKDSYDAGLAEAKRLLAGQA